MCLHLSATTANILSHDCTIYTVAVDFVWSLNFMNAICRACCILVLWSKRACVSGWFEVLNWRISVCSSVSCTKEREL